MSNFPGGQAGIQTSDELTRSATEMPFHSLVVCVASMASSEQLHKSAPGGNTAWSYLRIKKVPV